MKTKRFILLALSIFPLLSCRGASIDYYVTGGTLYNEEKIRNVPSETKSRVSSSFHESTLKLQLWIYGEYKATTVDLRKTSYVTIDKDPSNISLKINSDDNNQGVREVVSVEAKKNDVWDLIKDEVILTYESERFESKYFDGDLEAVEAIYSSFNNEIYSYNFGPHTVEIELLNKVISNMTAEGYKINGFKDPYYPNVQYLDDIDNGNFVIGIDKRLELNVSNIQGYMEGYKFLYKDYKISNAIIRFHMTNSSTVNLVYEIVCGYTYL